VCGKAIPHGIYDVANDEGWVNVGETADTAAFAVESYPTLVEPDGTQSVPRRRSELDRRGCRWFKRVPAAGLEG
jgi:hypothetical protein